MPHLSYRGLPPDVYARGGDNGYTSFKLPLLTRAAYNDAGSTCSEALLIALG